MQLSEKAERQIEKIIGKYQPNKEAALLPILYIFQNEFGYLDDKIAEYVAEKLLFSPVYVRGVTTFYTMYNKNPVGKYFIQVCTNVSCSLLGAEDILKYIEKKLNIKTGDTTSDGKFTLMPVECLGSCGTAPVVQINDDYYENITEEKIDEIIEKLLTT